jgi:hypothetical protein
MKLPVETSPFLWGTAAGAVALAFVGFNWGGWVTGGTSESLAVTRTNVAVAEALGPMCVDKFKLASGAAANLEALKKADSWAQADMIEKGGWASVQGPKALDRVSAVAKVCATLLLAPATPAAAG